MVPAALRLADSFPTELNATIDLVCDAAVQRDKLRLTGAAGQAVAQLRGVIAAAGQANVSTADAARLTNALEAVIKEAHSCFVSDSQDNHEQTLLAMAQTYKRLAADRLPATLRAAFSFAPPLPDDHSDLFRNASLLVQSGFKQLLHGLTAVDIAAVGTPPS